MKTVEQMYGEFKTRNPNVLEELYLLAYKAHYLGRRRIGIKHLIEVLRWDNSFKVDKSGRGIPPFKINNNFAPLFARDIVARNSQLKGLFETRKRSFERGTPLQIGGSN